MAVRTVTFLFRVSFILKIVRLCYKVFFQRKEHKINPKNLLETTDYEKTFPNFMFQLKRRVNFMLIKHIFPKQELSICIHILTFRFSAFQNVKR